MIDPVDVRARRDAQLRALTRIGDMLERGCWPHTGAPITPDQRRGLERTLDAIRAELRRTTHA